MAQMNLKEISEIMRDIDYCMLTTQTGENRLESRPMSNNRKVDYDGDSYFFSYDDSEAVREIAANPQVNLGYARNPGLIRQPTYISVAGTAELVYDREEIAKHWAKDAEAWFEDGIDTPGLVMIHVHAEHLKYWHGHDTGEITV